MTLAQLRLPWRSSLRYLYRHPWQLALCVLGMGLGVAVVVAVDLCIESTRRALALGNERLTANVSHQIVGGPSGVPETLFTRLRREVPAIVAAPVVEARATLGLDAPRAVTLLGVDPISEGAFRTPLPAMGEGSAAYLLALMTRPGSAAMASHVAAALGLAPGDSFALAIGARPVRFELVGVFDASDGLAREWFSSLVLTDISTAQEVLGRSGRLSRIDLAVARDDPHAMRDLATLDTLLPAGTTLVAMDERSQQMARLTHAFELNLFMLSLLALVVGMFLVYNAFSFSVVQRRALIGSFRTLGLTRREVLAVVLAEVALVALIGSLLGVALGIGLATQLIHLVTRTIDDLYFVLDVRSLTIAPGPLLKTAALGWIAGVLAALVPAIEATRVAPRAALARAHLESGVRRLLPYAAALGAGTLAAGAVMLSVPYDGLGLGFAALFAVVLGFALLTPFATHAMLVAARPLAGLFGGRLADMALRGAARALSRTGVAAAALMVALATVIGVAVMVDSFRRSVADWLAVTLRADYYVGRLASHEQSATNALRERIRALPEVQAVSFGNSVAVESGYGPLTVIAIAMAPQSYAAFRLTSGHPSAAWAAFEDQGGVLVSEPLAWHRSLATGDRVALTTDRGVHAFTIAGVFRDYNSDQGGVLMSRRTYERYWDDRTIATLGVYAAPGIEMQALGDGIRRLAASMPGVEVRSNRAIREASLEVFDRTFTITNVLRILATIVAGVGVLSALMALQLERAKEIAVLRAQGLTQGQVFALVQTQTGALGLIAGLLAIPLGLAMALILIRVINRRSFGWTMDIYVEPALLGQVLALALAAALIAGLYPAYRMAATPPALALRED